jgi:hypothetical protein
MLTGNRIKVKTTSKSKRAANANAKKNDYWLEKFR